jgi:hypothetical protein
MQLAMRDFLAEILYDVCKCSNAANLAVEHEHMAGCPRTGRRPCMSTQPNFAGAQQGAK